ncbi:uncharacterized protein LOC143257135 isoform X2 [Tachypleus tridentatus]
MMTTDYKLLLTILAILILVPISTWCGTCLQNKFKMMSKTESDHEGFSTASIPYHNTQSNGFNEILTEESGQLSRPSKLDPLMINSPKTARESFDRSYFPINKTNNGQLRYNFEDWAKPGEVFQESQQKTQLSIRIDDRIKEQVGKTETAAASKSDVTSKRGNRPSLSIVSPLDILSQRLMFEMARRKMKQSQHQIMANTKLLKNLGKRNTLLTKARVFCHNALLLLLVN